MIAAEDWAIWALVAYFVGIAIWLAAEVVGVISPTDRWPAFTDLIRALPTKLKIAVSLGIGALGVWAAGHLLEIWP